MVVAVQECGLQWHWAHLTWDQHAECPDEPVGDHDDPIELLSSAACVRLCKLCSMSAAHGADLKEFKEIILHGKTVME